MQAHLRVCLFVCIHTIIISVIIHNLLCLSFVELRRQDNETTREGKQLQIANINKHTKRKSAIGMIELEAQG